MKIYRLRLKQDGTQLKLEGVLPQAGQAQERLKATVELVTALSLH